MDCDWTGSFELHGEERKRVLKRCLKILKDWGMMMPPGIGHSFTGRGDALLLEISKPCKPGDSIFDNREIGRKGVI